MALQRLKQCVMRYDGSAVAHHLHTGDLPQAIHSIFAVGEGFHLLLQPLVELAQATNLTPELAEGCSIYMGVAGALTLKGSCRQGHSCCSRTAGLMVWATIRLA